jgi:hypothetical protein
MDTGDFENDVVFEVLAHQESFSNAASAVKSDQFGIPG